MQFSMNAGLFEGRWVGESQECESPAHLWHIRARGDGVQVETVWEGHAKIGRPFHCNLLPDQNGFAIETDLKTFHAVLLDPQHFVIEGWDTNDMRNNKGQAYDVIFSRPGLAELNAHQVWLAWKKSKTQV